MAVFDDVLTTEGQRFLMKMLSGETQNIQFTRLVLGDGSTSADLKSIVSPIHQVAEVAIDSVTISAQNDVTITAIFKNTDITEGFYMREKAIFASDGTKEVLVLYANAGSLAEYIEPSTSEVYEKILRSILLFSQSDKVNITMYDSGYANALDFQKHIENESIHVTGEDKSKWNEHLNCIATTTSSGHIKIGKGLQVQNGVTSVNLSALIDAIYPIGTVYTSVKDVSPEVFLGGKWERFAEGRTTVGVDLNNSNYNAAGKTGGSATTRLNASNVPSHTHNFNWTGKPSGSASTNVAIYESGNHIHTAGSLTANDTGLTGYIGNIITERESGITCSGVFSQRTSVSSSRYGGGTQSNKAPDFADFNATHGHSLRGNTEWGGQHGHTAAASTILNFNNMTVAGNTSAVNRGG